MTDVAMEVSVGISATIVHVVSDSDTAIALGSGDVPVLGTPRVIALCEEAAVRTLVGVLGTEETSVGTQITLEHRVPTPVGGTVRATATVSSVEGPSIVFALTVTDGTETAAVGTHTRRVLDRGRFLASL